MRIFVVCSKNSGKIAPFIMEQAESLINMGLIVDYYTIERKGVIGYMKCWKPMIKKIKEFKPDVIHAHYGLSGLLANLQRKIPVVTTYHGSDINNDKVFRFSKISIRLSAFNVFVSERNMERAPKSPKGDLKNALIPCGVDVELFKPLNKVEARKKTGLNENKKYVLFAGAFENKVKNAGLAIEAVSNLKDVELIELKAYTREQVATLMNAVDCVLMTSFTEGSPQFIKEAMACNCPIVSVPVGDVPELIEDMDGCVISTYEPKEIATKLMQILAFGKRTEGRKRILDNELDLNTVALKIVDVYKKVLSYESTMLHTQLFSLKNL